MPHAAHPQTTGFRVLLVDDHALFRAGMALLVKSNPLIGEVLEAGNVAHALDHAGKTVHLILLDHYMPGVTGLAGIQLLRNNFPGAAIALLSGSATAPEVQQARDGGADGFIPKAMHSGGIQSALSALLRGQTWFADDPGVAPAGANQRPTLTGKQAEVLARLCEGLSNRAIAHRMEISENTVRTHVSAILFQLNVNSRAEAIVAARKVGLIQ